jgi:hypothetical protein
MRKLLRYLRITFSAAAGVLCMLLIVLWVRSFSYWDDAVLRISSKAIHPISAEGRIIIWIQPTTVKWRFRLDTDPISIHHLVSGERGPWLSIGFWPSGPTIWVAHCVLVMVAGACAITPWCPVRFSLRSLLIGTTATAAILGVILWADQLGNHCEKQRTTPNPITTQR